MPILIAVKNVETFELIEYLNVETIGNLSSLMFQHFFLSVEFMEIKVRIFSADDTIRERKTFIFEIVNLPGVD